MSEARLTCLALRRIRQDQSLIFGSGGSFDPLGRFLNREGFKCRIDQRCLLVLLDGRESDKISPAGECLTCLGVILLVITKTMECIDCIDAV
jgi:hypothetical protein